MAVKTLIDGQEETGASDAIGMEEARSQSMTGIVQAIVADTATVKLEGSLDGSNWYDIKSFSSSGVDTFTIPPFLRGNVSAWTSGATTLKIDVPPRP